MGDGGCSLVGVLSAEASGNGSQQRESRPAASTQAAQTTPRLMPPSGGEPDLGLRVACLRFPGGGLPPSPTRQSLAEQTAAFPRSTRLQLFDHPAFVPCIPPAPTA